MKKEIGKNVSSGAEKVERIEEETAYKAEKPASSPKKPARKKTAPKKVKQEKTHKKADGKKREDKRIRAKKKEEEAAQKRVEKAKKKAAKKEEKLLKRAKLKEKQLEKKAQIKAKKLEKRAALKEKRAERIRMKEERKAALKEKKLEKKQEREKRRELLKNESKAEKAKRHSRLKKERIALRRRRSEARDKARERKAQARERARERRAEERKHKREERTERKKHAPGFGGWLAAVISLGTACLALATVVTAGAIRMNDMESATANGYRSTLYEMVSVSEDMDDNLSKLRVSSGREEQRRLLTDLLVDSELMESALERIPVDEATGTDISAFVNRTGTYARRLINQLSEGKELSETEKNTINYLAEVNANLYRELNELVMHMDEKDFRAFLNGGKSDMMNKFQKAGEDTHKQPETELDAPFLHEGNIGRNQLEYEEEVSAEQARQLVGEYFAGYHVKDVSMTGEGTARGAEIYNFVLTDENGIEIYAEVSKLGGKLMFFDTYELCEKKNFDLEECNRLAKEYLEKLGIYDVEASFLSDAGMVADITYVGVQDGVRVYPECIRVRVCEEKGRVVGMDASGYLFNHKERSHMQAELSEKQALSAISKELTPYEINLTLIAQDGREKLAYEIACYTDTDDYLVYVDATNGKELQLCRIREGENGKFIR